jgi:tetratricopeptide (TPR) repeat protein
MNGSKYGMFTSATNPSNPLVFNKEYMMFFDLLKKIEAKEVDVKEAAKDVVQYISRSGQINQHPDFLYLIGKFKVLQGRYEEAYKLFERSLEEIEKDSGIVNHESWILKELIRTCKYIQTV